MREFVILILVLFNALCISAQSTNTVLVKTIERNGSDTLQIIHYDAKGREVFFKSFPQYGISQILTHSYINDELVNYTWSHSNVGFVLQDYVYDKSANTRITYGYSSGKEQNAIPGLMTFYSEADLKASKQYRKLYTEGNRFLKGIAIYQDTFLIKEVLFMPTGDTDQIVTYTYQSKLLIAKRTVLGHNHSFNDLLYYYDDSGNETKWVKVFGESDTAYEYRKVYTNNRLVSQQGIEHKKLYSNTIYEYVGEKLVSEKQYDEAGHLRRREDYYYNPNNTINKIVKDGTVLYYIYQ